MKIGLICGGPSLERGISLNSARSLLDHLEGPGIEIVPFYLDQRKKPYRISVSQLYSNTPSDFDFKLSETAMALSSAQFTKALKATDIVFPVMHGAYGEDGGIQSFLEKAGVPFVGSGSESCKQAFDKFTANEFIREKGFFAPPSVVLKIYGKDHAKVVRSFFKSHDIRRAVVKPASGGSSIGVFSVANADEALDRVRHLFKKRMDTRVVIEPFAEGKEFTVIIVQNKSGLPVALPPTEIETDYAEHQIFDFRKKYLPTRHVTYHSPPRFDAETIEKIEADAEQLFALFKMSDFARFDGWVFPDGRIWFCDFNTISGMEQNSFLFQQASRAGLTHSDILRYIVGSAARRSGLDMPVRTPGSNAKRKKVTVIFGGPTSERQVSLMSGTNVWLKLRASAAYEPHPVLIDTAGDYWRLPYQLALNHTVEEIAENCRNYAKEKPRLEIFEKRARMRLGLDPEKDPSEFFDPVRVTLPELAKESGFVFIALHGGAGEDGTLQTLFEKQKVRYNGPSAAVCRLSMDKWATAARIRELDLEGIRSITGTVAETATVIALPNAGVQQYWKDTCRALDSNTLIVKPRGDGCSTGIVHLFSDRDLAEYLRLIREKAPSAPRGTFRNQTDPIEFPPETPSYLVFERFIETDILRVKGNTLKHTRKTGLIEITVGVVGMGGAMRALNPSITVAEGEVLSVEEKFQGGTGVNLTPPPSEIIKPAIVKKIRERMETLAAKIGIIGYSRIDAFVHTKTGDLSIIEINSLPGLTPSTVLYHQGLAEDPAIFPRQLLEQLIKNKGY